MINKYQFNYGCFLQRACSLSGLPSHSLTTANLKLWREGEAGPVVLQEQSRAEIFKLIVKWLHFNFEGCVKVRKTPGKIYFKQVEKILVEVRVNVTQTQKRNHYVVPIDMKNSSTLTGYLCSQVTSGTFIKTSKKSGNIHSALYHSLLLGTHYCFCCCVVAKLCATLCNPVACSPAASSVHEIS